MATEEQRPNLNSSFNSLLISRAQKGDERALEDICSNTLPYITTIANTKVSPLTNDELIQAALAETPGMVLRFDRSKHVPFSAYVAIRVRGAMIDEERILSHQNGLNRYARKELQRALTSNDCNQQLIEFVDNGFIAAPALIEDGMIVDRPASLDNYDSQLVATSNPLEEVIKNDEIDRAQSGLKKAFKRLSERQISVLVRYFGLFGSEQFNLREIGEMDEVGESRISQIKTQALGQLALVLEGQKEQLL